MARVAPAPVSDWIRIVIVVAQIALKEDPFGAAARPDKGPVP